MKWYTLLSLVRPDAATAAAATGRVASELSHWQFWFRDIHSVGFLQGTEQGVQEKGVLIVLGAHQHYPYW